MDEIAVSKFKATCLAALEKVRRTGRPLRVTRFGTPLADVVPARSDARGRRWLGAMAGTARLADDLIAPAEEPARWEGGA